MTSTRPPAASAPPLTPIDLTQSAPLIDNARWDDERGMTTALVATSLEGEPDIALKGSLMVWDKDHLAWWERIKRATFAAVGAGGRVAVFVRNPVRDPHTKGLRFYGVARVVDDPELRLAIWERVIASERALDPDCRGDAVLVRIDRVRHGIADIQRR
jgi:hypothetical protein